MNKAMPIAAGAFFALLLSACGPGTGGSGGELESSEFLAQAGARAAPVCAATWTQGLSCEPPVVNNVVPPSHPGTTRVQFASDASGRPEFVLSFEGNQISLEGGCPRRSYVGTWGQPDGKAAAFFGGYLDASLSQATLGIGTVKVLPASGEGAAGLQLELRSSSGQLLTLLQVQKLAGSQTSPRSCP